MASHENQGEKTSAVFAGNGTSNASIEFYGKSAEMFSRLIKQRLPDHERSYILADIGGFKGELLADVLKKLPDHKFQTIAIDTNREAIKENAVADQKIVANATKLPLENRSVDIAMARYVLNWNLVEEQKKILSELVRIAKDFVILQHAGTESLDQLARWNTVLDGKELPKLLRKNQHYSSVKELETWMKELGVHFEKIEEKKIERFSDCFVERYNLNKEESAKLEQILGDKDYIIQSTWILFPGI